MRSAAELWGPPPPSACGTVVDAVFAARHVGALYCCRWHTLQMLDSWGGKSLGPRRVFLGSGLTGRRTRPATSRYCAAGEQTRSSKATGCTYCSAMLSTPIPSAASRVTSEFGLSQYCASSVAALDAAAETASRRSVAAWSTAKGESRGRPSGRPSYDGWPMTSRLSGVSSTSKSSLSWGVSGESVTRWAKKPAVRMPTGPSPSVST